MRLGSDGVASHVGLVENAPRRRRNLIDDLFFRRKIMYFENIGTAIEVGRGLSQRIKIEFGTGCIGWGDA